MQTQGRSNAAVMLEGSYTIAYLINTFFSALAPIRIVLMQIDIDCSINYLNGAG